MNDGTVRAAGVIVLLTVGLAAGCGGGTTQELLVRADLPKIVGGPPKQPVTASYRRAEHQFISLEEFSESKQERAELRRSGFQVGYGTRWESDEAQAL